MLMGKMKPIILKSSLDPDGLHRETGSVNGFKTGGMILASTKELWIPYILNMISKLNVTLVGS